MNGRINDPAALQQQITGVVLPLSVLAMRPTCRFPDFVKTLGGLFEEMMMMMGDATRLYNMDACLIHII